MKSNLARALCLPSSQKCWGELPASRSRRRHSRSNKIPDDLRMNIRVVDADGGMVVQGRNLAEIRLKLGEETARRFAEIDDGPWRRDGLTSWDLDDLPEEIQVGRNGMLIKAYPMLIDQGQSVSLRLSDCLQTALHETRGGLRRLFLFDAYWHITPHVDWLPGLERMQLLAASISALT